MSPASPDSHRDPGLETLSRVVRVKERRRLRARQGAFRSVWFGLGMFGVVGWSVVVPSVLMTMLGVWLDSRYPSRFSWTLTLLPVGVALGCLQAWYWIRGERRAIDHESKVDGGDTPPSRPSSREHDHG